MKLVKAFIRNSIKAYVYFREHTLCSILNLINFYLNDVEYLNFPITKGIIHINNKGKIKIGKNVYIISGTIHNPVGGSQCHLLTKTKANILIGDGAKLSNVMIYAFESVEIGKDVLLGGGCKIYDSDFHSLVLEERLEQIDSHIKSKPVKVCDGVFIGSQSIILKGVTIGKKSIVGAGSVVTKSIPSGEIWAGNPAKYIKKIPGMETVLDKVP